LKVKKTKPSSQGFSLEDGRGGKRPWHWLVTCPSYTLKLARIAYSKGDMFLITVTFQMYIPK